MSAHHIRQEKIKIIDAIEPPDDITQSAVFGQYAGDAEHRAYHELEGVAPGTSTETYAAIALHFDNWRQPHGSVFLHGAMRQLVRNRAKLPSFHGTAAEDRL